MEVKKDNSVYYLKTTVLILIVLTLALASTYAWLLISLSGTKSNSVVIGTLSLKLDDSITDGIFLDDATPVTDATGLSYSPYKFSITNDGNIPSTYVIYLDNAEITEGLTRMNDEYVRYNLVKNGVSSDNRLLSSTVESGTKVLDRGTIEVGDTYTYDLRLWIDKDVDNSVMLTMFAGRIRVEAEQIKE